MDPPEPYSSMYDPKKLKLLDGYTPELADADKIPKGYFDNEKLTEEKLRQVMSQYYGTITHIDDGVGLMLKKLKEKGIYDESLIIYTSDHGDYMGHRHLLLKGNYMYDSLARIPLIIKYPASWKKTGREDALSSNIDIAGTICSVCGIKPAANMQGFDLTQNERRKVAVCEKMNNYGIPRKGDYMVRTATHKLLINGSTRELRLFDLVKDPLELKDIAGNPENKNVILELKELLFDEMTLNGNKYSYLNHYAPVINGKTWETVEKEREPMIEYMREKSKVKPSYD